MKSPNNVLKKFQLTNTKLIINSIKKNKLGCKLCLDSNGELNLRKLIVKMSLIKIATSKLPYEQIDEIANEMLSRMEAIYAAA